MANPINNSLRELHEKFIKHQTHVAGNTRVTIKNHRDNFALLLQFKPGITLADLTQDTMIDFFENLDTKERKVGKKQVVRAYKASSRETVRGKLNTFFEWLILKGYLTKNPFKGLPHAEVRYTDKRAFTNDQFEKICVVVTVRMARENLLLKKRNLAMVITLALTGLRKNEFISLQLSDLDIRNKLLTVRAETSKSRIVRTVPIHSELLSYLQDYLQARSEYTTPNLWVSNNEDRGLTTHGLKHFTDQLTEAAGFNCHLHRFRHTFAVNFWRQTHDILTLNKLMGHKTMKMTVSYLRSLTDDDTVQQLAKMTIREFI